MNADEFLTDLNAGAFDARLREVYGEASLAATRERLQKLANEFTARFDPQKTRELAFFSAPGRTELGGNHTDHQNGQVLCAAIGLDTLCCAARNGTDTVNVFSYGHKPFSVKLGDFAIREAERSTSPALLRGILAKITEMGFSPVGFDLCSDTLVPCGAGLSSSAAFEVLLGTVVNDFSCGGKLTPTQIAQIGQFAECTYYGKPCGLMDQMACAVGGIAGIDFADPANPLLDRCTFDLHQAGYALCLIESGADHADLDDEYAAIPQEMGAVARFFGQEKLRFVDEAAFFARRAEAEAACGRRAALRAEHFFAETKRARAQYEALRRGDFAAYLALVRESGASSRDKLQNVTVDRPNGDFLLRVIEQAERSAGADGAARVHGGGFAGTVQAYVPLDRLDLFREELEALCGKDTCHAVAIRDFGGIRLI